MCIMMNIIMKTVCVIMTDKIGEMEMSEKEYILMEINKNVNRHLKNMIKDLIEIKSKMLTDDDLDEKLKYFDFLNSIFMQYNKKKKDCFDEKIKIDISDSIKKLKELIEDKLYDSCDTVSEINFDSNSDADDNEKVEEMIINCSDVLSNIRNSKGIILKKV